MRDGDMVDGDMVIETGGIAGDRDHRHDQVT